MSGMTWQFLVPEDPDAPPPSPRVIRFGSDDPPAQAPTLESFLEVQVDPDQLELNAEVDHLVDELGEMLLQAKAAIASYERVKAVREQQGKPMSNANQDLARQLAGQLDALDAKLQELRRP